MILTTFERKYNGYKPPQNYADYSIIQYNVRYIANIILCVGGIEYHYRRTTSTCLHAGYWPATAANRVQQRIFRETHHYQRLVAKIIGQSVSIIGYCSLINDACICCYSPQLLLTWPRYWHENTH